MGRGLKRSHHHKTLVDYRDYRRIKRGSKKMASRLTRRRGKQDMARDNHA